MFKTENSKEYTVCYNNKGEKVESVEIETKQEECQNFIDFCCIADVPEGFTLDPLVNPNLTDFCVDLSALKCCLETKTVETRVENPCEVRDLNCLVDIQAVRLVGCIRVTANIGPLIPNQPPFAGRTTNCTANCNTTVCVDQILNFTCDQIPPCDPCYEVRFTSASFGQFIDECGREAVRIAGQVVLDFVGCDEPI